jgi:hypothetical protein
LIKVTVCFDEPSLNQRRYSPREVKVVYAAALVAELAHGRTNDSCHFPPPVYNIGEKGFVYFLVSNHLMPNASFSGGAEQREVSTAAS